MMACHLGPRNRSSVLPECSYCPACIRKSSNALLTASQSPFSAAAKNGANPGAAALVAAFACASFSATNDFSWATTSGFLMDSQLVELFLAHPPPNSRQRANTVMEIIVVFMALQCLRNVPLWLRF